MNIPESLLGTCLTNRRLSLILLSTEACNLRCVYCYAHSSHGRMKAPVLSGVKNLIRRRVAELDNLDLSWFGGEPLMALSVIRDLHRYLDELFGQYPEVSFNADMTTNAYLLTRKLFRELLGLGIAGFQIAFDGPRRWHDQKRTLPDGSGTFDRIWSNVKKLREESEPFKVMIRLHVDAENVDSIPGFIDEYRSVFGGDSRFELFIRPLSRLGGPNDDSLCTLEGGLDDPKIGVLRQLATSLGIDITPESESTDPCYAARANSFVIRADGRINKCSIVLEDRGNQVGRLEPDGSMKLNTARMLAWMRGLNSGIDKEMNCPLAGFQDPNGSS